MQTASDWYRIAKGLLRFNWHNDDSYAEDSAHLPVAFKLSDADLITSEVLQEAGAPGLHKILIDLDVPAVLVPSSTEGHSHLYIDVRTTWENIEALLDALVATGAVEEGYAGASKERRMTRLRVPWRHKRGVDRYVDETQKILEQVKELEQ